MFRSPFHDHPQGSFLVPSAFTTFYLPASSFVFFGVCGRMPSIYMCALCTCLCVVCHDQTTHRQVHRAHIQIEGIRLQTPKKTNDEAGS
jgi:hypothetical protein